MSPLAGGFWLTLGMAALCLPLVGRTGRRMGLPWLLQAYLIALAILGFYLLARLTLFGGDPDRALVGDILTDAAGYYQWSGMSPQTIMADTFGVNPGYALFLNAIATWICRDPLVFLIPQVFMAPLMGVVAALFAQAFFRPGEDAGPVPDLLPRLAFIVVALDFEVLRMATSLLKDSPVSTLIAAAFVPGILVMRRQRLRGTAPLILGAALALAMLRLRALVFFLAYTTLPILPGLRRRRAAQLGALILLGLVLGAALYLAGSSSASYGFKAAAVLDVSKAEASLAGTSNSRITDLLARIPFLPLRTAARMAWALLIPLPPVQCLLRRGDEARFWLLNDLAALYWHALLPFLVIGVAQAIRERQWMLPITLFLGLSFMGASGWVDARWRMMTIVPTAALTGVGILAWRQGRQKLVPAIYYACLAGVSVLWYVTAGV